MKKGTGSGFSMIEVTLALGIVSFTIISVLGLLTGGLNLNRDSVANTEASSVAREIAADLQMIEDWSNTSNTSPRFQISVQPATPSAPSETLYVTRAGTYLDAETIADVDRFSALFRVDLSFGPTSGPLPPVVHIVVSWPTGVAGNDIWPSTDCVTYEVIASLSPL